MPNAPVDILNMSLSYLGKRLVTSLDSPEPYVVWFRANYPQIPDDEIIDNEYTFATTRLLADADTDGALVPEFEYQWAFPLTGETAMAELLPAPRLVDASILRILAVSNTPDMDDYLAPINWRIEGRYLLINEKKFYVKALVRVEDVAAYPPDFVQALALKFAALMAPQVTGSDELTAMLHNMHTAQKRRAETTDAKQGAGERSTIDVSERSPVTGFGTRQFRGW